MYDLQEREPHYKRVLSKGEYLIVSGHPAPGPIEVRDSLERQLPAFLLKHLSTKTRQLKHLGHAPNSVQFTPASKME